MVQMGQISYLLGIWLIISWHLFHTGLVLRNFTDGERLPTIHADSWFIVWKKLSRHSSCCSIQLCRWWDDDRWLKQTSRVKAVVFGHVICCGLTARTQFTAACLVVQEREWVRESELRVYFESKEKMCGRVTCLAAVCLYLCVSADSLSSPWVSANTDTRPCKPCKRKQQSCVKSPRLVNNTSTLATHTIQDSF